MKKFFMAFLAVATIAMIGCKKDEPTPTPTPGPDPDPSIEIPDIAAPGAGKTTIAIYATVCPKGAYLVGNFNGYNINDDAASFAAVEGAEHWYKVTIDFAADLAVKAIARPSDDDVPFSWSYQWGPNFDEAAETPLVPDAEHNKTVILKGDGDFELENQGEVKLVGVADNGVVYVQVKEWKSSPVVEAKPLETAWAKTNWDGGDWAWREMTKKSDGVFEVTGVWGGNGFNIAATEGGADSWYPTDHAEFEGYEGQKAGDEVKVTFTSQKGTVGHLKMELVSAAADVPAGNHKFTITISNRTYTDGDVCIFTGNFEEKSWADSDREMTYVPADGVWTWEGAYPKNFEYKVIYNGKWATGDNAKVQAEGETFTHTFEIGD